MLQTSAQSLLSQQRAAELVNGTKDVATRMSAAATRRFPAAVEAAHLEAISRGALAKDTFAWMLGVLPDALEVPTPQSRPSDLDFLASELGLRDRVAHNQLDVAGNHSFQARKG